MNYQKSKHKIHISLASVASSILTFIIVAYLFSIQPLVSIGDSVKLQTKDGNFTFLAIPSKGRDIELMNINLEIYKTQNKINGELKIYRKTPKNYLQISNWNKYLYWPEYQYPYLHN